MYLNEKKKSIDSGLKTICGIERPIVPMNSSGQSLLSQIKLLKSNLRTNFGSNPVKFCRRVSRVHL